MDNLVQFPSKAAPANVIPKIPDGFVFICQDLAKTIQGVHSFWGVMENLLTEKLPAEVDFQVVAILFNGAGKVHLHYEIQDGNGKCLEPLPGDAYDMTDTKYTLAFCVRGFKHEQPGPYRVALYGRINPTDEPKLIGYYPYGLFMQSVK